MKEIQPLKQQNGTIPESTEQSKLPIVMWITITLMITFFKGGFEIADSGGLIAPIEEMPKRLLFGFIFGGMIFSILYLLKYTRNKK